MFGLLRPQKRLVSAEDWSDYSSAYCNLCATLAYQYGVTSRLLVVHDVATADWLLSGACPVERPFPVVNCLKGGTRSVPQPPRLGPAQQFLAAVSAYVLGIKVEDDLADGGGWKARLAHALYRDTFSRAREGLRRGGFDVTALEDVQAAQRQLERRGETALGTASAPSGAAFGLVARFLAGQRGGSIPAETAFQLGDRIGRLVFLVDAYRDFARDVADGTYNPLRYSADTEQPLETGRLSEAREWIGRLLTEGHALCGQIGPRVADRWRATAATLAHQASLDPDMPEGGFSEGPTYPREPEESGRGRRRRRGEVGEGRNRSGWACDSESCMTTSACCDVTCCCLEVGECF